MTSDVGEPAAVLPSGRGMRPCDIGRIVTVDEVRVSPDGRWVAAVVSTVDLAKNTGRRTIWVGTCDGVVPLAPFTAGASADASPRFSPDASRLAFVSHRGDGDDTTKGSTLHIAPIAAGGEVRRIASWPEEITDLAWSPDGTTLAFGARVADAARTDADTRAHPPRRITRLFSRADGVGWVLNRPRQLFVIAADGTDSAPAQLTEGEPGTSGLGWHPEGDRLVFGRATHATWDLDLHTDLWTVPAVRGEAVATPTRLTNTDADLSSPSWSPAGAAVAAIWSAAVAGGVHTQVAIVDPTHGTWRTVTSALDRNIQVSAGRAPVWLDEDRLLVSAEHRGGVHLHEVTISSGTTRPIVDGQRQVSAYDAAAGVVVFADTDHTTQCRIVVATSGSELVIAEPGRALGSLRTLVEPTCFRATAPDGAQIEAWFAPPAEGSTPAGEHRHPTLLLIHGGPFTQYGARFFDEVQMYAGAGFGVVFANPRGSSGYSEAWGTAINFPGHPTDPGSGWGGVDATDLEAVIDDACRRFPEIDPERLGVLGGSYGGYMTTWLSGHDPAGRWKAACSERAANNLVTIEVGASDIATVFRGYTGVPLGRLADAETVAVYRQHSASTYAPNITCPMLIMHSEGDLRCPIDQADELFVTLRLLGREVEYVRFPGESHGLSRAGSPRHRVQRAEAIIEWFTRFLREPAPSPTLEA